MKAIEEKLRAAGFEIANTGGNIMLWARETKLGFLIYIGDEVEGGEWGIGEAGSETKWGTQVTNSDGEEMDALRLSGTLDYCLAEMALLDADDTKMLKVGDRVGFRREWEIFPCDLIIGVGEKGTVHSTEGGVVYIKMDDTFPNLAEWSNEAEIGPDNAELNGFTFPGWLLHYLTVFPDLETEINFDIECLTTEYTEWNEAEGLDLGSADEHHDDEALTDEQREWLRDFSARWELASPYYGKDGLSSRNIDARLLEALANGK